MASDILLIGVQLLILLIAPPFFVGVINRVKSFFAGRKGPPVFQPYIDIYKLLRKGATYSRSTSWVFRLAPLGILAAVVCAGVIFPFAGGAALSFAGDAILFVYLLGLARFLTIIAALDTASSFEGMGGSREAIFGAFSELTVFVVLVTLAIVTKMLSLTGMFGWTSDHFITEPTILILTGAFVFILLTENSRMPVDDPNTHLELTMIHEVMILDYSGPDLGVVLYAASMKLFIFMSFAVLLISPNTGYGVWQGSLILLAKVLGAAVLIGLIESVTARIRLIKVPQSLVAAFVLSLFALVIALFGRGVL